IQFSNKGTVVAHLVVGIEIASTLPFLKKVTILIAQHMKTMRITGDYLLEAILGQGGNIALSQGLERRFIAQSSCHITAVALFSTQHGEVYFGSTQYFN